MQKWKKITGTKNNLAAICNNYCDFITFREYINRKVCINNIISII